MINREWHWLLFGTEKQTPMPTSHFRDSRTQCKCMIRRSACAPADDDGILQDQVKSLPIFAPLPHVSLCWFLFSFSFLQQRTADHKVGKIRTLLLKTKPAMPRWLFDLFMVAFSVPYFLAPENRDWKTIMRGSSNSKTSNHHMLASYNGFF